MKTLNALVLSGALALSGCVAVNPSKDFSSKEKEDPRVYTRCWSMNLAADIGNLLSDFPGKEYDSVRGQGHIVNIGDKYFFPVFMSLGSNAILDYKSGNSEVCMDKQSVLFMNRDGTNVSDKATLDKALKLGDQITLGYIAQAKLIISNRNYHISHPRYSSTIDTSRSDGQ